MSPWVEISFDCLPLRSVGRLDVPMDASPAYQERCRRIQQAIDQHGCHNSYYLYNAECKFHFTNDESRGTVTYRFEGTLLTNEADERSASADLEIELAWETCDWLSEPIVEWLKTSVQEAVLVDFNRYISAGDLTRTKARLEQIQTQLDESGGYLGMYL